MLKNGNPVGSRRDFEFRDLSEELIVKNRYTGGHKFISVNKNIGLDLEMNLEIQPGQVIFRFPLNQLPGTDLFKDVRNYDLTKYSIIPKRTSFGHNENLRICLFHLGKYYPLGYIFSENGVERKWCDGWVRDFPSVGLLGHLHFGEFNFNLDDLSGNHCPPNLLYLEYVVETDVAMRINFLYRREFKVKQVNAGTIEWPLPGKQRHRAVWLGKFQETATQLHLGEKEEDLPTSEEMSGLIPLPISSIVDQDGIFLRQ